MNIEIELPNFPDWAVTMAHITPIFYSTGAFNLDELHSNQIDFPGLKKYRLTSGFNYWFRKNAENNYTLKVYIIASLRERIDGSLLGGQLPIFVDLNLHIINERVYDTYQDIK